jgi:hypothetical protein
MMDSLAFLAFFLNAVFVFSSLFALRPTRFAESRKRPVPGRVHSIY